MTAGASGAWGLVHLAIDKADFGAGFDDWKAVGAFLRMALLVLLNFDDFGFDHFVVEIVSFACALTDTGKHGNTAVELGDIVDEFHDDDGLAHSCASECADLAAFQEWADQIDDFDSSGEHLRARGLIDQRR